jgi:hypothetical protein
VAQEFIHKSKLVREKRELARRARRLAQTLLLDADRTTLLQLAEEMDREAESLERSTLAVSIPPVAAPTPEVDQQQCAEASIQRSPGRSD